MGRLWSCAVVLVASLAWADGEPSVEQSTPSPSVNDARHAVWLHTAFENQLGGAAVAYEHWFNRSISVQLALGGSYDHSAPNQLLGTGGLGGLGGLGGATDTWSMGTEVQLRWHLPFGVFFAEALGAQWQRITGSVETGSGIGVFGADSTHGFESVLAGWAHTFDAGLRVELFAGPSLGLSFAGPSAMSMSANALSLNFRYGLGLGYVF